MELGNEHQRDALCANQSADVEPETDAEHDAGGSFKLYDLSDEEVHFSKESSTDKYLCYEEKDRDSTSLTGPRANNCPVSTRTTTTINASDLRDHDANLTVVNLCNTNDCQYELVSSSSSRHSRQVDTNAKHSYVSLEDPTQMPPSSRPHTCNDSPTDQVRSSRLLHAIGSKLRRGSNYLIAPKLLGEYLLGITIQSWTEFFNTTHLFRAPIAPNRHQLGRRLVANLNHFQGNYLCVSLVLVIYCILTSPILLLAIAAYLLSLYLVTARSALGKQTRILGYKVNLHQQYSMLTIVSLPTLWVAGAPGAVFWVIGASFFVVGVHASAYANEKLFILGPTNALSTHELNCFNQTHSSYCNDYWPKSKSAPLQYYNHYNNCGSTNHNYHDLASCSHLQTNNGNNHTRPSQIDTDETRNGNSVSSTLSHWMSFGASRVAPSSTNATGGDANGAQANLKTPGVKIISQDYAGLGRVYEV